MAKLTAFGSIKTFSESTVVKPRIWYPTSFLPLDHVMGAGRGIPSGCVIEAFGPKSCGKTTTLLSVAADLQRRYGAIVVLFDTEGTIDDEMLRRSTIDTTPGAFLIAEGDEGDDEAALTLEAVFANMYRYMQALPDADEVAPEDKVPVVFLWDSVGGTGAKDVNEALSKRDGTITSEKIGAKALALTNGTSGIGQMIRRKDVIVLACNQARANIGVMYGEKEKPAGGYAWDHAVTVRLHCRQMNSVKEYNKGKSQISSSASRADDIVGTVITADCKKNKVSAPYKKATLVNIFDFGIDAIQSSIIHVASQLESVFPGGILKGGKVNWADSTYTIPALAELMRAYPEHWDFFEAAAREELASLRQAPILSGDLDTEDSVGVAVSTEPEEED